MNNLYQFISDVNKLKDPEVICLIIELFLPKIKKSNLQTTFKERDDLEQTIKLRLIEKIKNYDLADVPDFFEFKENIYKTE